MSSESFADRILEIAVTGSVVRLDFGSLSVTDKDANNQPRLEFRQRIVMPAEGFVQSFGLMAQVMQDLEKRGLLRRADAPTDDKVQGSGPASPNFR